MSGVFQSFLILQSFRRWRKEFNSCSCYEQKNLRKQIQAAQTGTESFSLSKTPTSTFTIILFNTVDHIWTVLIRLQTVESSYSLEMKSFLILLFVLLPGESFIEEKLYFKYELISSSLSQSWAKTSWQKMKWSTAVFQGTVESIRNTGGASKNVNASRVASRKLKAIALENSKVDINWTLRHVNVNASLRTVESTPSFNGTPNPVNVNVNVFVVNLCNFLFLSSE